MKKASLMPSVLVGLIILLIVSGMLFFVWNSQSKTLEATADISACKSSIMNVQTITDATMSIVNPKITCPAPHRTLKDSKDANMLRLAKDMRDCWDKTGGSANTMGYVDEYWDTEHVWCLACSTFEIKTNSFSPDDFAQFLNDYQVPNTEKTFQDYFSSDMQYLKAKPGDRDRLWDFFVKTKVKRAIPPFNAGQDWTSMDQYTSLPTNSKFFLIFLNYGLDTELPIDGKEYEEGEYSHMFIVNQKDLAKLGCTVFEYETQ